MNSKLFDYYKQPALFEFVKLKTKETKYLTKEGVCQYAETAFFVFPFDSVGKQFSVVNLYYSPTF